ncbi:hypothetical protein [Weissella cibaria]|uniref:hypothetical protein n=1 Tax=Weissella cibaria TaxID=137591 RepID=UPI0005B9FC71|nr:hypothetical protein [Weissella cibaria]MBD1503112.1 hypothetical protein [Weissella cibaria]MDV8930661.1 hypothetical protein [Weissella cibaria]MDY2519489.1 hypothetical protein [Weissella cibaria]
MYKQLELEGIADSRGGKYSLLGDYINDLIAIDSHRKEWHITRDKIGYYLQLRIRSVDAAKARHVLLPKPWIISIDALEAYSTEIDAWLLSVGA